MTISGRIPSEPYLVNGTERKILHLSDNANEPVHFTMQVDRLGDNQWEDYKIITVEPHGYQYYIFPSDFKATWARIVADQSCKATAFFHTTTRGHDTGERHKLFAALADIDDDGAINGGIIRPAAHNKSLQFVDLSSPAKSYYEINEKLEYAKGPDSLKKKSPGYWGI